jgi:hypothetical protein
MLPAMHQACAETTGALWSSRTMTVSPLSSVVRVTALGSNGSSATGVVDTRWSQGKGSLI